MSFLAKKLLAASAKAGPVWTLGPQIGGVPITVVDGAFLSFTNTSVLRSYDGIEWETLPSNNGASFNSVVYSPELGRVVAFPYTAAEQLWYRYSDDLGANWTTIPTQGPFFPNGAKLYGNGVFVATYTGTSGSAPRLMYSADGVTWTETTFPAGYGTFGGMAYDGAEFFLVRTTTQSSTYLTSTNGAIWSSFLTGGPYSAAAYGNNTLFFGPRFNNGGYAVRFNGRWSYFESSNLSNLTFFTGGLFVNLGGAGSIKYSTDAINWHVGPTIPAISPSTWIEVISNGNVFLARTSNGKTAYIGNLSS